MPTTPDPLTAMLLRCDLLVSTTSGPDGAQTRTGYRVPGGLTLSSVVAWRAAIAADLDGYEGLATPEDATVVWQSDRGGIAPVALPEATLAAALDAFHRTHHLITPRR